MSNQNNGGDNGLIDKYRAALRGRVGEAKFDSWFADIALAEFSEDCVTLSTASKVKKEMMDSRWLPLMRETWRQEIGPVARLRLTVRKNLSAHAAKINAKAPTATRPNGAQANGETSAGLFVEQVKTQTKKREDKKPFDFRQISSPLDNRKTFDSYAVADSNRMASAAAKQVFLDGAPRELVYFHGPSGVGKTHLEHAIGGLWAEKYGEQSVIYIPYSNLISACVNAVWSNSLHNLHEHLLSHDILIVDDIHLLDTKSRTQEELLNAIDAFLARGKQVVIAGEAPPAKLPEAGISQRLADRLAGGVCVPILPAEQALRLKVLQNRLIEKSAKCTLSPEALEFVASRFHQSMRETIGAMNQLLLMYQQEDVVVTLDDAKTVLKPHLADRKRIATLDDAIKAGALAFGLKEEEITCRAQPQRLVRARHAIVYCAREVLHESFPRIGKALKRDHTTAMSSYRRAQALLERDKVFQDAVLQIREALEG